MLASVERKGMRIMRRVGRICPSKSPETRFLAGIAEDVLSAREESTADVCQLRDRRQLMCDHSQLIDKRIGNS